MTKYIRKPEIVEAIQFESDGSNLDDIREFVGDSCEFNLRDEGHWCIETAEGDTELYEGSYVIKGVEGEFYACDPAIFEATHVRAE